jgi:menaquinone-specific isochorismate synthase
VRVTTRPIDAPASLVPLLDPAHPLLFVRRGEGVAGFGETVRLEFSGPDRIRDAATAWRELAATAEIDDPVGLSGTGLIAFGAFTFAPESDRPSVLVVPRVVVGVRDGVGWITRVRTDDDAADGAEADAVPAATALGAEYRIPLRPGELGPDRYRAAVAEAVRRIQQGALHKVVLARDLAGHLPEGADLRRVIGDLALGYPDTWTFAVDGLIGSSPETLVRVNHGTVTARVLAGSAARGLDAPSDHGAALALATSTKDLDEHRFAVESVLAALEGHARGVVASEMPFALKLPNLWHLASDVEGALADGSSVLDLAAALHPTAAVAGSPTEAALAAIAELEGIDRRRYGGPVGWVDADGNGKWAIALRSAEVAADGTVTAYAGAGIVAESDPERELAETALKFRPVAEAFR